jgi:tRNA threonylcarbamoyladenosine biosynthesis protein TsaB
LKILAIEQSTATASLAVLEDDRVICRREWREARHQNQQLFTILRELGTDGTLDLSAIDLFVAGLGPGSFAGMRMAVSTVRALALPGHKTVRGISSGRALAWAHLLKRGTGSALVAGDARRNRYWMARFTLADGAFEQATSWTLVPRDDAQEWLKPDTYFLSPDFERVPELIAAARVTGMQVLEGTQTVTADDVGRLAVIELQRGLPSEPLEPIYIHPAVFVAPRFT